MIKTKIRFSEPEVFTNKAKGKTTVVMDVDAIIPSLVEDVDGVAICMNNIIVKTSGVARIKEGDEFDFDLGRYVASDKAKKPVYAEVARNWKAIAKRLEKLTKYANDQCEKYEHAAKRCEIYAKHA